MNYRSVVLFGVGRILSGTDEKNDRLFALTERIMPGRWNDSRLPTANELKATTIIEMPIDSATAKIRTGGPKDDAEDYASDWWAGVIPIQQNYLPPDPDVKLEKEIAVPPYLKNYKR